MTEISDLPGDRPIWARDEAFPPAPDGWGWVDRKGQQYPVDSLESLATAVRDDRGSSVDLVWTPRSAHLVIPEEVPELFHPVFVAKHRSAAVGLEYARSQLMLFGAGVLAIAGYEWYQGRRWLSSVNVGMALLLFLMFALIPWYQAWKRARELRGWSSEAMADSVPPLRFEAWLDFQKAPVTRLMAVAMVVCGAAQMMFPKSIDAAGLVKSAVLAGERWRLLTAPFLHGGLVHWFMNFGALLYLGKRVEAFARWPHVPLVFLFSAWVGGEASVRFVAAPSVGASGGLMGWLGFLLVFETLHERLVPKSSRRRLLAGVVATGVIGVLGYRFIDNAAHAGGLLAGMVYAAVVFPKSTSVHRPQTTWTDRVVGGLSVLGVVASVGFAVMKISG